MEVRKIVSLDKDEIKKLLAKFVEKKVKAPISNIFETTDGGLEFHITPTTFDETGD